MKEEQDSSLYSKYTFDKLFNFSEFQFPDLCNKVNIPQDNYKT